MININNFITKKEIYMTYKGYNVCASDLGFYVKKDSYKSRTFSSIKECQEDIDYAISSFPKKICLILQKLKGVCK